MGKNDKLTIIAQSSGFKNLKIEGGWRLQLDIFESRLEDVLMIAALVNKRETMKVTFEPMEPKKDG